MTCCYQNSNVIGDLATYLFHYVSLCMTATIQIYEWCCYMRMSGYLPKDLPSIGNFGSGKAGNLPDNYLSLLDKAYTQEIKDYADLKKLYDVASRRAATTRTKSTFPDKTRWDPEGRTLTLHERELLNGPNSAVSFLSTVEVEQRTENHLFFLRQ